jgi:hypothetical protein
MDISKCQILYMYSQKPYILVLFFNLLFITVVLGYIVIVTKVLTIYHSWIHPSIILLYPASPIPGVVSTGFIFPFSYVSTWYFHHIQPPSPFPCILYLPTGSNLLLFTTTYFKWYRNWGPVGLDNLPSVTKLEWSCVIRNTEIIITLKTLWN